MIWKMSCLFSFLLVLGVATPTFADWSDDFSEDPQVIIAAGKNDATLNQDSAAGFYTSENATSIATFGWVPEGYITVVKGQDNPRGFGYLVDAGPNPGQIAPGTYEFTANMTWDDNSHGTLVDVYVLSGSWTVGFRGGALDPSEEGIRAVVPTDDAALAMKVGSLFFPEGTPSTEESPVDITIPNVVVTEGSKVLMFCYFYSLPDDALRMNSMALKRSGAATLAGILQPADGTTDVVRDGVVLEWTPGVSAGQHDVYFGTSFDDVNNATVTVDLTGVYRGRLRDSSYAVPECLDLGETYYWRVDEVNAPPDSTVLTGDVWSFTAEPEGVPLASAAITATASSVDSDQIDPNATINGAGLDEKNLHNDEKSDMWLCSVDDPEPWIRYDFDKAYKLHEMKVWNHNSDSELTLGHGIQQAKIETLLDGETWTELDSLQTFNQSPGTTDYAANTTVSLGGAMAQSVRITALSNWSPWPQFITQKGLSEVQFSYIPVWARKPDPDSGATDMDVDVALGWRAGREAAGHDVYLGTDEQAVIDGTVPVATVTEPGYGSSLDLASTYYWRIDEVNDTEIPTAWQGDVWNLSTQEYLVVEDFESYNDIEAGQEGSNLIYLTWVDGFDNPAANGSTIGYTVSFEPTMESSIVYDGRQSVPFFYNNTAAASSEITANVTDLQASQDWTQHGIKALTIRFHGDPNNSVNDQMYVKLNGSKVAYEGEAANLARAGWQMWYIDLASIGASVSNVATLSIGFERAGNLGGQGVIYLDGIRLYSHDRQVITPADPGTAGLRAHYGFEGNTNDSSINARHGTIAGNGDFVVGKVGQAINLRSLEYVEVTGYKGILGSSAITVTAWIKTISTDTGAIVGWGPDVSGERFGFRMDLGRLRAEHAGGNVQGDTLVNDGSWHHVAVTVRENVTISYPDVILYLDGADDTRPTTDADPVFNITAAEDVSIGRRPSVNDRYFIGQIDEVRIYDRALTQEEVTWLAGRTVPFDKPF